LTQWDRELDATGLACPLPILKCKKLLNQMSSGETVRVLATDPGAPADFADFAQQSGHRLLDSSEAEGVYRFVLEKA
jgi:tRNA 2-thiouridine synthesizing protein A